MGSRGAAALMRYFVFVTALVVIQLGCMAADDSVSEHCGDSFSKVTECLSFATGKAATPTKECCKAVTDIRASDPACLCYVIELTHNGSEQIRSLGIQEARLIQLPSVCQLKNSSITDCPQLLGIPPSSPNYAIFSNTTAAAGTPPTTSGADSAANNASDGTKFANYHLITNALPVIAAIVFTAVSQI